ncbi:aminodeoxychorismate/anthranilate synthase component II [Candidatus Vidania fulgoroideorum]
MIIFFENYDSFSYNVIELFKIIKKKIIICNYDDKKILNYLILYDIKIICIGPGPGNPIEYKIYSRIIKYFYKKISILGICLGHQILGVFFGFSIEKSKEIMHGKTQKIKNCNDLLFNNVPKKIKVTRYNSLIIKRLKINNIKTLSKSDNEEIMIFKHIKFSIIGIQFHLESIKSKFGLTIIKNFVKFYSK